MSEKESKDDPIVDKEPDSENTEENDIEEESTQEPTVIEEELDKPIEETSEIEKDAVVEPIEETSAIGEESGVVAGEQSEDEEKLDEQTVDKKLGEQTDDEKLVQQTDDKKLGEQTDDEKLADEPTKVPVDGEIKEKEEGSPGESKDVSESERPSIQPSTEPNESITDAPTGEEGDVKGEKPKDEPEIEKTIAELTAEAEALGPTADDIEANKIVESKAWEATPDVIGVELVEEVDSDEEGKRIYASEFTTSLGPFRTYSYFLGRFPFYYKKDEFGFMHFYFKVATLVGLTFIITTVFHFLLLLAVTVNLFGLMLNYPKQDVNVGVGVTGNGTWTKRAEELYIFRRNAAPMIIFMCSLIHVCIANYHVLAKREFIANYFTFWTEAVQIIKLHAASGVFNSMTSILFVNVIFMGGIFAIGWFRFVPVTSGAPGLLVILLLRSYDTTILSSPYFMYYRYAASVIFFYILICGKIYVFLFLYKCKLIRNIFSQWNHRLDVVLNRSDDFIVRGNRLGKRTGFRELFEDHVVLLDLIDGSDVLFAETMESFFTCEVASFCFQLYYCVRVLTTIEEFKEARQLDVAVMGLILLNSIILISLISSAISSVSDQTMDGLEILRRKGFFGRKSPEELYFLLSLYTSYNGHFETAISGSGYYVMNQGFLLSFAGSFLAYMVILLQFSPPLALVDEDLLRQIPDEIKLLTEVETVKQFYEAKFKVGYFEMEDFDYSVDDEKYWPDFN